MSFRVVFSGSRTWDLWVPIRSAIEGLVRQVGDDLEILLGYDEKRQLPKGLDEMAYLLCQELGVRYTLFPPDWDSGKGAGLARNQLMVDEADHALVFWDGKSPGAADCGYRARQKGILRKVYLRDGRKLDESSPYLYGDSRAGKLRLPPLDPLLMTTEQLTQNLEDYGWEYDDGLRKWRQRDKLAPHPHLAYLWEIRGRPDWFGAAEDFAFNVTEDSRDGTV